MKIKVKYIPYYLFILVSILGCKKNFGLPETERNILAPIAYSELTIGEILTDTTIKEGTDNQLQLIYRDKFATIAFDTLIELPNSTFNRNTKISNLELGDRVVNSRVSLGMIAENWPFWGPIIIAADGSSTVLPDITGVTSGPFLFSVDDIFQTATFDSGYVDFEVINNFPVDIANLDFEFRNQSDNQLVIQESFAYIASGGSDTKTIDLTGKTVEGNLLVSITNLDILGGNQNVPIDTSDDLLIEMTIRDTKLYSATAIFPAQNLIDEKVNTPIDSPDMKFKNAEIKSGNVIIDVNTTIQDTIYFTYTIPAAILNSIEFTTSVKIPPAPGGGSLSRKYTYDFSGYSLDLTGEFGNSSNIIYSHLIGRIDSSGEMRTLSKDDSLKVSIYTENLVPRYVEGFLGNEIVEINNEGIEIDLFNSVISGGLELEEVTTSIYIENELGIGGSVVLNQLTASDSRTGNQVDLSGSIVGADNAISAANSNPYLPSSNTIELNKVNSNINVLTGALPDFMQYDLDLYLNKGVDTTSTDFLDFVYDTSTISADIEISFPLSLVANDLTLHDTAALELNVSDFEDNNIEGMLNLIVDNGFPLSANLKLYLVRNDFTVIDSLITEKIIEGGITTNGIVTQEKRTTNSFILNRERIDNLQRASYMLIYATFDSGDSGYDKILSNYKLKISLAADFLHE